MSQSNRPQTIVNFASVQERILLEKQTYIPDNKINGPRTDLFFHEIREKGSLLKTLFNYAAGALLVSLYYLTLPFICLLLKVNGKSCFRSFEGVKKYGDTFGIKIYNIGYRQFASDSEYKPSIVQKFLYKTGLYKLPMAPHILQNNINLVGPQVVCEEECLDTVNELTDFYKRFAIKPGYFSPVCFYTVSSENDDVAGLFRKELSYIRGQSSFNYLKLLMLIVH